MTAPSYAMTYSERIRQEDNAAVDAFNAVLFTPGTPIGDRIDQGLAILDGWFCSDTRARYVEQMHLEAGEQVAS